MLSWLDRSGDQLTFYVRALIWIPRTLRRYLKEVQRLLAEVAFGSGGLGVIGGTIGVMIAMTLATGSVVGLQGYAALDQIGTSAFTGFISAYFNTREIAPLVAGLALSATVGAGFTAQLGAMRINEEVDALEAMGVRSMPYLVTTRIIAGVVAIIPLYAIGLLSSYLASRYITVLFNGQSAGTYDHYFNLFLSPDDVLLSVLKVLIFSVLVILAHCYYGFHATGGPAGVGVAVGRSVRNAIVLISVTDFFLSLAIWGATTTVKVVELMPSSKAQTVRRRIAGVAFVLVPAVLVWVSVSVYEKDFSDDATVTVRTGSVGNEMHDNADVKLRGVVIGQVRDIAADGDGARLTLAIQPDRLGQIPADVTAQMLPTTLFGERFVALVPPPVPSARTLRAGSVIPQDRSSNAIELEEVLDNVLPMLTAVKPEKLAATLNAVSQALEGRGDKLGDTLVTLDAHLKEFNPQLPTLNADIKELVKVSALYADAAPDVLDALTDFTTTSGTIAEQQAELADLYGSTTASAQDVTSFLRRNKDNLIRLSAMRPPDAGTPRRVLGRVPLHPAHDGGIRPRHGQGAGQGHRSARPPRHPQGREVEGEVRGRQGHPGLQRDRRPALLLGSLRGQDGPDRRRPRRRRHGHRPGSRGGSHRARRQRQRAGHSQLPPGGRLVNELIAPSLKVQPQSLPDWSSVLIGPAFRGAEVKLK